eukprot:1896992-Pyramimonas_sp.AAC.1
MVTTSQAESVDVAAVGPGAQLKNANVEKCTSIGNRNRHRPGGSAARCLQTCALNNNNRYKTAHSSLFACRTIYAGGWGVRSQ